MSNARPSRNATATRAVVLGGEPRVDLLPAEVLQARRGASSRRGLIVLLVVCLAIVVGGYALSLIHI